MFRFALIFLLSLTGALFAEDVPGSSDHPLIGRFEGSEITGYKFEEFDEFDLPEASGADGFRAIEGRVYRIAYILPENVSLAAAERNFEVALAAGGFETIFQCDTADCGEISYDVDQLPLPRMIVDRFNYRVLTARLARPEGDVYAQIVVSIDSAKRSRVQVSVVETAPLEIQMIDATAMQSAVFEDGRVALYGIQFDTDSATIKPESVATLEEVGKFLAAVPELSVVIVGHTDNQGSMEYNLALSQQRAKAVRDALVDGYGIAADRMEFAGAGFLAPVAPNLDEAGRALNRRVEIIAR